MAQSSKKGNNHNNNNNYYYSNNNYNNNQEDEAAIEKMRKDIEANQDNALSLCTEKVLLARQAYDLVGFFYCYLLLCIAQTMLCVITVVFYNWCKGLMSFEG